MRSNLEEYFSTGHGVESKDHTVVNPEAPSFLAVNKKTGKVEWKDNSPGKNIMEGQWNCGMRKAWPTEIPGTSPRLHAAC